MRPAIAVGCCLLLATVAAAQNASPSRQALCAVSGQVVQEPGGMPIRKVLVSLPKNEGTTTFSSDRDPQSRYATLTDAEGRFRLEGVQAGEYRLSLERNGFVTPTRRSRVYSSTLISLTAGQELTGLLLRMQPAGVVQGKIVDEDGDAMPGVNVIAMSPTTRNGFANAMTNDLGGYRLAGLPRGEYLVLAQSTQEPVVAGAKLDEARVYAPTYYPGTTGHSQASRIQVHPGDEASVSFNLVSTRTFTVRGSVSGLPHRISHRTPQSRTELVSVEPTDSVSLESADNQVAQQFSGVVLPDGRFEITGVLPGSYRTLITDQDGGNWRRLRPGQTIEVRNADLDGVRLVPEPTGELRGHFRMDDGQQMDWSQVSVLIDPDEREETEPALVGNVAKDGLFKVENVPAGSYHAIVTSNSNSEAWRDYISKEVIANGKDVGDSGFSTAGGVTSVDIVVSAKGGSIVGTVVDDKDAPIADVQVVCIPDSSRRKRRDVYQEAQTDPRGHFVLRGLNPGEYQVFALDDPAGDISDPEFVRTHEALGQSVKLDEGARQTISLKVAADGDQP